MSSEGDDNISSEEEEEDLDSGGVSEDPASEEPATVDVSSFRVPVCCDLRLKVGDDDACVSQKEQPIITLRRNPLAILMPPPLRVDESQSVNGLAEDQSEGWLWILNVNFGNDALESLVRTRLLCPTPQANEVLHGMNSFLDSQEAHSAPTSQGGDKVKHFTIGRNYSGSLPFPMTLSTDEFHQLCSVLLYFGYLTRVSSSSAW
mmetsp:Transcript_18509/g.25111  ORF Transcript_18509/g.25111 Transcript_18509/m.25111 type:complete len:204 (-) Transcript_18509:67-678(-)